ncbi:exonuclease III protein [Thraustotheca clavata]|uniref:Exonuclease III protein n=1 Tax=Thraustotheca clavata TaxID=74557 RepID=A0A1V9ZZ81_9STRA|nr:exonuclease III protein [Thraustotheca clavata]
MVYRYLLVLDFEATCSESMPRNEMEIIEFPIVVIDTQTKEVIDEFHSYVKPVLNGGKLEPFCIELTGIAQDVVDNALPFEQVYTAAQAFAAPYLTNGIFVTCGDWDLKTMLPTQCAHNNLSIPSDYQRWVNIKFAFKAWRGQRVRGMTEMLNALGLPLIGRHHSGIDDTRNIAAIAIQMLHGGWKFRQTNLPKPRKARKKLH